MDLAISTSGGFERREKREEKAVKESLNPSLLSPIINI
jgi:hypothetical protein